MVIASMSTVDRIRFAHWMDLHEIEHVGVDSEGMWNELDVLSSTLPVRPKVGDSVKILDKGQLTEGYVGHIYHDQDQFVLLPLNGGEPEIHELASIVSPEEREPRR